MKGSFYGEGTYHYSDGGSYTGEFKNTKKNKKSKKKKNPKKNERSNEKTTLVHLIIYFHLG